MRDRTKTPIFGVALDEPNNVFFRFEVSKVETASCLRASMTFWLREKAGHSKLFAAPYRFTIGRRTYSGSVEKLQIRFGTGILMPRPSQAHPERILANRHPDHRIKKRLEVGNFVSTCKGDLPPNHAPLVKLEV